MLMNCRILRFEGKSKLEKIYFQREEDPKHSDEEFWVNPDIIIGENGIGTPLYNLRNILTPGENEAGEPDLPVEIDSFGIPSSDIRFSLLHNVLHSTVSAAGSCT